MKMCYNDLRTKKMFEIFKIHYNKTVLYSPIFYEKKQFESIAIVCKLINNFLTIFKKKKG